MSDKRDKKQPNASNYEQTARLRIITSEEIEALGFMLLLQSALT